ncbi:hypothetical protein BHM03_00061063, partial [Ensete ventricosum]
KLLRFPPNRVVESGTNLESSRFLSLLADHLEVNAQDVQVGKELIEISSIYHHMNDRCAVVGGEPE